MLYFTRAKTLGIAALCARGILLSLPNLAPRPGFWPGFLPWAITEHYEMLKSAFSSLRTFEESGGTPAEIANAQADVVHAMGVMGHYVGDSTQPLHTTIHNNGWVGANPKGYTTWEGFHAWIDGGFNAKIGLTLAAVAARARPANGGGGHGRHRARFGVPPVNRPQICTF